MQFLKKIGCILIMCLIVSSCTAQPLYNASSGMPEISESDSFSSQPTQANFNPADYAHIAPWRVAYYQVADAIENSTGTKSLGIRLYYPTTGEPFMRIDFYEGGKPTYNQLWCCKDNNAQCYYDDIAYGNLQYLPHSRLRITTGSPVVMDSEDGIYYEIVGSTYATRVPLYRTIYNNDGEDEGNSYHDEAYNRTNGSWERLEPGVFPEEQFSIQDISDGLDFGLTNYYFEADTQLQILSDYFLDTYQPPIPDGAPEWVTTYMRYLRCHMPAYYSDTLPDTEYYNMPLESIDLVLLPDEFGAPAIYTWNSMVAGEFVMCQWMPDGERVDCLVGNNESVHFFNIDQNNNLLITFENAWNTTWYKPAADGLTTLFQDGFYVESLDGYTAYVHNNGEYKTFTDPQLAENWWLEKQNEALTLNGFAAPVERLAMHTFQLPATSSWPEYEAALIDALCQFAKSTGQWENI